MLSETVRYETSITVQQLEQVLKTCVVGCGILRNIRAEVGYFRASLPDGRTRRTEASDGIASRVAASTKKK